MQPESPPPPPLAGTRCVVTGGLGFIGSNLVRELAGRGVGVTVIDAMVPQHGGDRENVSDLEVPGLDVKVLVARIDAPEVADAVAGAEVIFNVAGQVSHLASIEDPLRDLDLNLRSHVAFLEMVRVAAPGAIVVQTSTRQVYGRPQYLPVDEQHPTSPVDINGIDKLACEQLHLLYGRMHGLRVSALRLTNVYGPRLHLDRPDQGFLAVFIRRALLGDDITLFGDGSQRRDCLHVDDVVDAMIAAATCPEAVGEVFNLGHHESLTLADIAGRIIAACGTRSVVTCVPWPEDLEKIDIGSFQGDYSKASDVLGWKPSVGFTEGIRNTIGSYRERAWSPSST
ncbi:MAG TPA: NAD-dependent epimerase/dehydratase family protein [Ilumatobacteraceae bacterium]|nr:NAD-dependent epimerase/dehydratase family protein [Ilumatobacteraceae bacterium]